MPQFAVNFAIPQPVPLTIAHALVDFHHNMDTLPSLSFAKENAHTLPQALDPQVVTKKFLRTNSAFYKFTQKNVLCVKPDDEFSRVTIESARKAFDLEKEPIIVFGTAVGFLTTAAMAAYTFAGFEYLRWEETYKWHHNHPLWPYAVGSVILCGLFSVAKPFLNSDPHDRLDESVDKTELHKKFFAENPMDFLEYLDGDYANLIKTNLAVYALYKTVVDYVKSETINDKDFASFSDAERVVRLEKFNELIAVLDEEIAKYGHHETRRLSLAARLRSDLKLGQVEGIVDSLSASVESLLTTEGFLGSDLSDAEDLLQISQGSSVSRIAEQLNGIRANQEVIRVSGG